MLFGCCCLDVDVVDVVDVVVIVYNSPKSDNEKYNRCVSDRNNVQFYFSFIGLKRKHL